VTDTFIASQAFVFFAAGFETSSTTMAHAMYELAQNHKIQERLRDEIKQVLSDSNGTILYDDIKKMTYLEQVFRGSFALRLFGLPSSLTRFSFRFDKSIV